MKLIDLHSKLLDVIRLIEDAPYKTVYVCDNGKLVGSVTDGDVRRALVEHQSLDISAEKIMNSSPTYRDHNGNVINKKRAGIDIKVIPSLNEAGSIVDESLVSEKYLPIAEPLLDYNEFNLLDEAYKSTWISSRGYFIDQFENNFSSIHGIKNGVTCANGTAALFLALSAIGLTAEDDVIIPTLTFGAVANAVILAGGNPVFVDCEEERPIMDVEQILAAASPKTKAVIVVHSYGYVVDIEELRHLLPSNIFIIEDCAEAHFAKLNGKMVGTLSDISCFSFFANKILTMGEGGICLTDNTELALKMRMLRDHGMSPAKRYWHLEVGFNLRLTNLQAAIGVAQLKRISSILEERKHSEHIWTEFFQRLGFSESLIPTRKHEERGLWLFNAKLDLAKKTLLKGMLKRASLEYRNFFYCLHKMPPFYEFKCLKSDNAETWERHGLSLPVYSDSINNRILKMRLKNVHHS